MFSADIIGAFLIVFLTLSIFSYLFSDNPFYKFAEHLFVGIAAGYVLVQTFWTTIRPNLFGRLWPAIPEDSHLTIFDRIWYGFYDLLGTIFSIFGLLERSIFPKNGIDAEFSQDYFYIIPFILGIFLLLRLVPKLSWLSKISIAFVIGMASSWKLYYVLNSNILKQIQNTTIDITASWGSIINEALIFIGVFSGLIYFFFSKEQTGAIGKISKVGIYFLMIKFGASFGFAVMGRISLLIGRFSQLQKYNSSEYSYLTIIILAIMLGFIFYWNSKKPVEADN